MQTEARIYTVKEFDRVATLSCENEETAISLAISSTKSGEYVAYVGPYGTTDVEYKHGEKQLTKEELEALEKAQETDYPFIRLWAEMLGISDNDLDYRLREARRLELPFITTFNSDRPNTTIEDLEENYLIRMLKLAVKSK